MTTQKMGDHKWVPQRIILALPDHISDRAGMKSSNVAPRCASWNPLKRKRTKKRTKIHPAPAGFLSVPRFQEIPHPPLTCFPASKTVTYSCITMVQISRLGCEGRIKGRTSNGRVSIKGICVRTEGTSISPWVNCARPRGSRKNTISSY